MAKVTVRNVSRTSDLKKQLKKLGRSELKVGIFDGGDIGMIAEVQEYGASIKVTEKMRKWFAANGYPLKKETATITIPERSFIRSGFDENENKVAKTMEGLLNNVIESNMSVDAFLDAIGISMASYIKKYLVDLNSPANSNITVGLKGSSNPLVDTGRLRDAIKHKVE